MAVPYSFASATGSIPLSQLDANFNTVTTLGNTSVVLGNTVSTINSLTLGNVTITSGTINITNGTYTTLNVATTNTTTLAVQANATVGGNVAIAGNVTVGMSNANSVIITGTTVTNGAAANVSYLQTATNLQTTLNAYPSIYANQTLNNGTSATQAVYSIFSNPIVTANSTGIITTAGIFSQPNSVRNSAGQANLYGLYANAYLYSPSDQTNSGFLYSVIAQGGIAQTANATISQTTIYGGYFTLNLQRGTSGNVYGIQNQLNVGSVNNTAAFTVTTGNVSAYIGNLSIGSGANVSTTVANVAVIQTNSLFVGATSGSGVVVVTNYYGIYLGTPTVQTTGSITNRYGVYQQDSSALSYFAGNVSIGTTTTKASLTVAGAGSFQSPSTVNAATYTMGATDSSLIISTTSCTITLLAASSYAGRILYVTNATANSLTSASSNVVPLGSTTAGTAILAATAGKFAMLQSDGTNWITMMAN